MDIAFGIFGAILIFLVAIVSVKLFTRKRTSSLTDDEPFEDTVKDSDPIDWSAIERGTYYGRADSVGSNGIATEIKTTAKPKMKDLAEKRRASVTSRNNGNDNDDVAITPIIGGCFSLPDTPVSEPASSSGFDGGSSGGGGATSSSSDWGSSSSSYDGGGYSSGGSDFGGGGGGGSFD